MSYIQMMNSSLFYFSSELEFLKKRGKSIDELGIKDVVLITQKKNQSIHQVGGNEENVNRNLEELSRYSSYIKQFIKAGVYKLFFNDKDGFEIECMKKFEPERYEIYKKLETKIQEEDKSKPEEDTNSKKASNKPKEKIKDSSKIDNTKYFTMRDLKKMGNIKDIYIKQQLALAIKHENDLNAPGIYGLSQQNGAELGASYDSKIILPPNLMGSSGILAGDVFKDRSSSVGVELLVRLNSSSRETRTQYTVNDNKILKYDIIRQE